MKTFTLSLPGESVPGAHRQRHWENTLVPERQGENICVPELLRQITLMGSGEGAGERAGPGAEPGGARSLQQMERVPRTGM